MPTCCKHCGHSKSAHKKGSFTRSSPEAGVRKRFYDLTLLECVATKHGFEQQPKVLVLEEAGMGSNQPPPDPLTMGVVPTE